ncbi:zeta toxin family protein [Streptomyces sp. NPDC059352]|uniref:zeta toxin family protein n=1 Tax=Streptomyces sp. NPDC059352 TaxID=3346810 RepID=UPI0036C9C9E1
MTALASTTGIRRTTAAGLQLSPARETDGAGQPVVVFVIGQPAGATAELADLVHAAFTGRGGAERIRSRPGPHLPHHQGADQVRPPDLVVEAPLTAPAQARTAVAQYRDAGYRVEVAVLATSEAWIHLQALSEFLDRADADTEPMSWTDDTGQAQNLLEVLAVLEAERAVDRITVLRGDHTVLYDNELVGGAWRRRTAADRAVMYERARPWSAKETAVFRRDLVLAERRLHLAPLEEKQRLAVQRYGERAAALAEPVRRIAQATDRLPGVNYHRLSQAEHQWIFDELIAPSYLSGIIPREIPRVVFLLAQPGAGKSTAARMILRSMRPGTTHLVGDDMKISHPDYLNLLTGEPRHAGAAVRADYRGWMHQAEAYVRARRGDLLVEIAPADGEEFLESALPFHEAGYPIEVIALAVRAADSRQSTALRYARAQQLGLPARFTAATGHNICFAAVPEVAATAAAHPAVAAVTTIRRDGTALFRSEGHDMRAVRALTAEQERPYTEQEAHQFLSLHRALRKALPRYRRELEEIAALAWPLMPPRMRPAPLGRPSPDVRLLPAVSRPGAYGFWSPSSLAA